MLVGLLDVMLNPNCLTLLKLNESKQAIKPSSHRNAIIFHALLQLHVSCNVTMFTVMRVIFYYTVCKSKKKINLFIVYRHFSFCWVLSARLNCETIILDISGNAASCRNFKGKGREISPHFHFLVLALSQVGLYKRRGLF